MGVLRTRKPLRVGNTVKKKYRARRGPHGVAAAAGTKK